MCRARTRPNDLPGSAGIDPLTQSGAQALPRLAVYRRRVLPYSEGFVLNQMLHMQQFQPVLVGRQLIGELPLTGFSVQFSSKSQAELAARLKSPMVNCAPRLVLAHFGPDGVDAYPLAVRLGVPLAVILHGYDVNTRVEWWRAGHRGHRMRGYPRCVRMLARDDNVHFIAISQANKRAAIALGLPKEKISVCYIGVDIQVFRPSGEAITARPPRVLFVGRLIENKGCEYLIRAMARVRRRVHDAELHVLGKGDLQGKLEQLARELDVNATFHGMACAHDVRRALEHARVLCLPSVAVASGESEGLGMVLLEAQASGLPVVGSRLGGIPEAILDEETGLLARPGDIENLAECLLRILVDDDFALKCAANGPAHVAASHDIRSCTAILESQLMEIARAPYRQRLRDRAARRLRAWPGWRYVP